MNYKYLLALSIILSTVRINAQNDLSEKISQQPNFSSCLDYKFEKDRINCRKSTIADYVRKNKNKDYRSGIVQVAAQIDKTGKVISSKAIDGPEGSIRAEAERLIWAINEWKEKLAPAKLEDVSVAYQDTFVLNFEKSIPIEKSKKVETVDGQEDELIFKIVESMPRFPGCEDMEGSYKEKKACADRQMLQYIYGNIKYPKEARSKRIQGNVVISFIVEKDGSVSGSRILIDKGGGLGEEALRVIQSFNDMEEFWIPGFQRGEAVRVQYNLPIKFMLPKKKKRSRRRN